MHDESRGSRAECLASKIVGIAHDDRTSVDRPRQPPTGGQRRSPPRRGGTAAAGPYGILVAAFLELAEPDIEGGEAQCVALGAERVILVPYFLSAGVHVQRDLTAARQRLAERFPGVDFRLAEPLGRHPLLLEVVAERAIAAEKKA